jgi:hypothetical protein
MRHLLLVGMLGASGCIFGGSHGSSSNGDGLVFDNCSGDCSLEHNPIAAGGARTRIIGTGLGFTAARTSDPQVATVHVDPPRVDVFSGVPGTTTLEVLDGSGHVVGSGKLVVVATSRLDVLRGWSGPNPRVLAGTAQIFHVATRDAQGNGTRGDGAVRFTLAGTLSELVVPVDGDAIGFAGTPGAGSISASCPDASVTQGIDVVAASDVIRVDANATVEPDGTAVVTVMPATAAGPVYTGPCAWETSDSSVTLAADVGPTLALGPGEVAVFNLNQPGRFTATCALAGQTATVTLER